MPRDFFHPHNLGGDYLDLEQDFRLGTPTAVFGVSEAHKALIAATCVPGRFVYIAADAPAAARAAAEIAGFAGERPALLCAKDEVLLHKEALSRDALFRRLTALYEFRAGARIVVCDIESLMQLFPADVPHIDLRELAGDPVESVITRAPGNDAPIGGVKITSRRGWFAVRPSGTEPICKVYTESFGDEEHLRRLQKDAIDFLDRLLQNA